ncbi:hypothetical protein C2S52_014493 [Perilla frutescens var. hirtella]|uniref:Uncharacterized protein n=1 Tax=Perilla frutescens var. hirtella TaxID=608512 RepID=A0AAD4P9P4_PERFH|nr:hypothetical protein C2S52_014493 [Perilla frutescens var. hirtella]KAH6816650.1 hypothetical protein C2S51_021470 [Perilla frutescens var. frutescens]KAH6831923.1 hypothetical protein C2S53_012798 [Perilla frutescens var. hirtella]
MQKTSLKQDPRPVAASSWLLGRRRDGEEESLVEFSSVSEGFPWWILRITNGEVIHLENLHVERANFPVRGAEFTKNT